MTRTPGLPHNRSRALPGDRLGSRREQGEVIMGLPVASLRRIFERLLQAALSACLLVGAGSAMAQTAPDKRVALVIGNGAYARAPLANPVNDAADLSAALRRLGFEVMERRNRNSEELKRDLIEFQDKLGPGAVGLFYFAGHGVQAGRGLNYLLPVGRDYLRERDAEMYGLEAGTVLRRMEESGAALSVVILDACRDSPLPPEGRSSGSRGFLLYFFGNQYNLRFQ